MSARGQQVLKATAKYTIRNKREVTGEIAAKLNDAIRATIDPKATFDGLDRHHRRRSVLRHAARAALHGVGRQGRGAAATAEATLDHGAPGGPLRLLGHFY